MSSLCIVIDSACDLSAAFIADRDVKILPVATRFGNQVMVDRRKEKEAIDHYRREFDGKAVTAKVIYPTAEQVAGQLVTRVAPRYDSVLLLAGSATRSPVYETVRKTLRENAAYFAEARLDAGRDSYFPARVFDTETLYAGEAVLAHEAVRLARNHKLSLSKLTLPLEQLRRKVYLYLVPGDPGYLRRRAQHLAERHDGWLSCAVTRMLDRKSIVQVYRGESEAVMKATGFGGALKELLEHTMRQVKQGLATKLVVISFAGDVSELKRMPLINEFTGFANKHGIEVMISVMSVSGAVDLGAGSLTLAFAAA